MRSSISKLFSQLGFGLALLSAAHSARADLNANSTPNLKKKKGEPTGIIMPTAVAEPVSTEVNRAGEVVIRLRGVASGGGRVEFVLQKKPLYGRIVRSSPVGLDSLDVVYRHSGEQRNDSDSFIFAVRAGGVGPLSPGEAKIRIIDPPGSLLAPELIPFPATFVGEIASDSFVVLNEGGQTLSGHITVTPPWHVRDLTDYRLKPGEKLKISLFFAPTTTGDFSGRLTFEGDRPFNVELRGEGLALFQASPAKMKLQLTPNTPRSGVVSLQNNTTAPITIYLKSQLVVPDSVTLQFGETQEITVSDSGIGPLNSFITLTSGAYSTRVDVSADEAPPLAKIPQTAAAAATPITVKATPTPIASPVVANPSPALAPVTEVEPAPTPTPRLPAPLIAAKITPLSRSQIRIDWTMPTGIPHTQVGIQQRYLTLDDDQQIKVEWVDVPSAKMTTNGTGGNATIDDLDADTVFTFRVQQTSGDNNPKLNSLSLVYKTEPGFFHRLSWRPLIFPILIFLLGFVLWKRWLERPTSF